MTNTKRKSLRGLIAAPLMLAAAAFSPDASARMTYQLNDTVRSGMNAMDHLLQKPLGNPVFENKRFGDHFFMSGAAGVASGGIYTRPGAALELQLGDWISPVHGWRITLGGGAHSVRDGYSYVPYGSVGADYLINFTSLLRGARKGRPFELVGGLGAEFQGVRSEGTYYKELGVRASLQTRFNLSRSLYLYLEPRLTLSAGNRYAGIPDQPRRFRPDLGLYVGLGYRLLHGEERSAYSEPFVNIDDSHLFFGAGVGAASFIRGGSRSTIGSDTYFFAGKWLSYVSALRLKAEIGKYPVSYADDRYIASGMLDYVWNITNAFSGYHPSSVFGLNLNLGVGLGYVNRGKAKYYPGVEAGLTASFRLSPNWSLDIEPQAQLFTRAFADAAGKGNCLSPMASVKAGLTYTIGNFYHDHPESLTDYLAARNYFLTAGAALSYRLRDSYGPGVNAIVGFGKRFTPVSSWRIAFDGEFFTRFPRFVSLGASADYLFSISTSMAGFNPDRVFDLSGLVGLTGGVSHQGGDDKAIEPLIGAKVGLHGDFRLCDYLDLFIEPQGVMMYTRRYGSSVMTPGVRLMAGLTYRLGRKSNPAGYSLEGSPVEHQQTFVSLSGGPTAFTGNVRNGRINGALDAAIGGWFNLASGLRVGVTYDFIPSDVKWLRLNMGTVHADYLLNISSLITRDETRRFHIIGFLGGGVAFSGQRCSSAGLAVDGGAQFRYNLPWYNIDLHIEPNVSFIMNRVTPEYVSSTRFTTMARLLFGVSYRF